MKKCLFVICMMLFTLTLIVPSFALETYHTHRLDPWGVQIDVPVDMVVVTPSSISDEAFFTDRGVDIFSLQKEFTQNNQLLTAYEKAESRYFSVMIAGDETTEEMWNFQIYLDGASLEELKKDINSNPTALDMMGALGAEANVQLKEIFDTQTAKYQVLEGTLSQGDTQFYIRIYGTVMNGVGVSVAFTSVGGAHTREQIELQSAIVNTLKFDQILDPPAPIKKYAPSTDALVDLIAGVIVLLMVAIPVGLTALLFTVVKQKMKIKNSLAPCLVKEPSAFEGTIFTYRGKVYDQEKFVSNAALRFNITRKNRDRILEKQLKTARRKAGFINPEAIIFELEAEAIAGLLHGVGMSGE